MEVSGGRNPGVSVTMHIQLTALLFTAIVAAPPSLAAQQPPASPPDGLVSASQDVPRPAADRSDLPVSLDKIREALAQLPVEPLKGIDGVDERPLFRVEIRERQRIEELLEALKFDSGPAVPGGPYAYEQQQNLFPKVNNPLAQPYGAFRQGELLQVSLTTLIASYLAGRIVNAATAAERARVEEAAREEVRQALEEFLAAQPKEPPSPSSTVPQQ